MLTSSLLPENIYSKICLNRPLKEQTKIGFQDRLSLNAGQNYCKMPQREHSSILSTFIKIFVLSTFEWPLTTGFTGITIYQISVLYFGALRCFQQHSLEIRNALFTERLLLKAGEDLHKRYY